MGLNILPTMYVCSCVNVALRLKDWLPLGLPRTAGFSKNTNRRDPIHPSLCTHHVYMCSMLPHVFTYRWQASIFLVERK